MMICITIRINMPPLILGKSGTGNSSLGKTSTNGKVNKNGTMILNLFTQTQTSTQKTSNSQKPKSPTLNPYLKPQYWK